MEVHNLSLSGLKLITPQIFFDERGFFKETYQQSQYQKLGITSTFVQDNHSFSKRNVLRGMHFQDSPGQEKLIYVIEGEIFDVAVDIRPSSKTFGKWTGIFLDSKKQQQLYIPIGFAHGFCVLSEIAHVIYKISSPYDAKHEKSFRFDDPKVGIKWPILDPIISNRDEQALSFAEIFS